ncbi:unnamed protein product [Aphanomyces euteiches]
MWCCEPRSRLSFFWSVTPEKKTVAEIEAEKWVLVVPYAPRRFASRFVRCHFGGGCCLSRQFLSKFATGPYKARDSVPPAKELAVVTFYVAVGVHGFAAGLFGPFVERHGPRHSLIIAVCLHIVGHILSFVSLYYKSYIGLYIGYGVFCGAGFGIGYIAPVSAVLKWFPDLRGTAGGFAICGVGLGATLWASINEIGQSSENTGRVSAVLGEIQQHNYVSVFDYREQELGEAEILYHNKIKNLRIRQCAVSNDFCLLYLVFIGGSLSGTVILSRVYDIGNTVYLLQNKEAMIHLVMYMSISNFLGRRLAEKY